MKRFKQTLGNTWFMLGLGIVFALVVSLLVPKKTQGLAVDPCCATTAVSMGAINTLTKLKLSSPLGTVKNLKSDLMSHLEDEVWSMKSVALGKKSAAQITTLLHNIKDVVNRPVTSAKTVHARRLESVLLSKQGKVADQVDGAFEKVYGALPPAGKVPEQVHTRIDMYDAAAKTAMKRAILLDELGDKQMKIVEDLQKQISDAAAGTAPMVEASASVHLLRANAYTQAAVADLARLRVITGSSKTEELKRSFDQSQTVIHRVKGLLSKLDLDKESEGE